MLVLTRKQGEQIRIGKDVTITVIKMKGKAIRLGIEAPKQLSVLRGELCDREAFGLLDDPSNVQVASSGATASAVRGERPCPADAWPAEETRPRRPDTVESTAATPGKAPALAPTVGPLHELRKRQP